MAITEFRLQLLPLRRGRYCELPLAAWIKGGERVG